GSGCPSPCVVVVGEFVLAGSSYTTARRTSTAPVRMALAAPFVLVLILPVVYWFAGTGCTSGCRHEARAHPPAPRGLDSAALIGHVAQTSQITPSRFISATAWAVRPSQSLST